MSTKLAELYARIWAKDELTPKLKDIRSGLGDFGTGLKDALLGIVGFTSAAALGAETVNIFKQSISEAADEETSLSQLGATIQSMGLSSEVSAGGIRSMAEAMQQANGIFSHDDLEKAAQSLLRVQGFDPSNLQAALKTMEDFAAPNGQSVADAANLVANALETGQTRSLHFSAALQTQIKAMVDAGDKAGALALIMDTLNSRYGGQAAAAMDTYNGKVAILTNNWTDLLAVAGSANLPTGKGILDYLNQIVIRDEQIITLGQEITPQLFAGLSPLEKLATFVSIGNVNDAKLMFNALEEGIQGVAASLFGWKDPTIAAASGLNTVVEGLNNIATAGEIANTGVNNLFDHLIDYKDEYSSLASYAENYTDSVKNITAAEKTLDDLRANHPEDISGIQAATQAVKDLQDAQEKMTDQWMLGIMTQQLSMDGLTSTEMGFLLQFQEDTGLITQDAAKRAKAQWDYVQALIAGVGNFNATVTTTYVTGYTTANPPPAPKYASGADFYVPSGFPNDTYPMLVSSGEHVSVTPAGKESASNSITNNNNIVINNPVPEAADDSISLTMKKLNWLGVG